MTPDEFLERIRGDDPFRISIRGQSAIEGAIAEAIEDAFESSANARARSFGQFERQLDLAIALGKIRREHRAAIMASARLRNEFAHGTIDDLSEGRVRELVNEVRQIEGLDLDDLIERAGRRPTQLLRVALVGIFIVVSSDLDAARRRREQIDVALEEQALREVLRRRRDSLIARLAELSPETGEGS